MFLHWKYCWNLSTFFCSLSMFSLCTFAVPLMLTIVAFLVSRDVRNNLLRFYGKSFA